MYMLVAGIAATLALSAGDNTIRPTLVNTRYIFAYEADMLLINIQ